MTRDYIDINDFTVLVEEATSNTMVVDTCSFYEPVVAVAFYGSGNVDLKVNYGSQSKTFNHTKGLALSFYADSSVEFEHTVVPEKPLRCILIATALRNLNNLPNEKGQNLHCLPAEFSSAKSRTVYRKGSQTQAQEFY